MRNWDFWSDDGNDDKDEYNVNDDDDDNVNDDFDDNNKNQDKHRDDYVALWDHGFIRGRLQKKIIESVIMIIAGGGKGGFAGGDHTPLGFFSNAPNLVVWLY